MVVGQTAAGFDFLEVDGFGFVEMSGVGMDGFEATDLRTWAANSARVAGTGRPGPMGRSSPVDAALVGGAGSMGSWDVG